MRSWKFHFPVIPVAKGRPVFNRRTGNVFTPARTRKAETELRWIIKKEFKEPIFMGPIVVGLVFHFTRPKSIPEKKRPHHVVKPDLTNLIKLIEDAGNGLLWQDDSQITYMEVAKVYSDDPGIALSVAEVQP
jgi:Holliday junction resolvase RusA-like endonuclease